MKLILIKRFSTWLILVSWVFTACQKSNDDLTPQQPVKTGRLAGTVLPITAVQNITLTNTNHHEVQTYAPDAKTGALNLSALQAGNYVLHYNIAPGYIVPADSVIIITPGKTTDLGLITLSETPIFSQFSYKATDGTAKVSSVKSNYSSPDLNIETSGTISYVSGYLGLTPELSTLSIKLDNVTGTGTFSCKGTPTSLVTLDLDRQAGEYGGGIFSSAGDGGSATVVITDINPKTRTISGTFTASLIAAGLKATGTQVITGGVFKVSYQ